MKHRLRLRSAWVSSQSLPCRRQYKSRKTPQPALQAPPNSPAGAESPRAPSDVMNLEEGSPLHCVHPQPFEDMQTIEAGSAASSSAVTSPTGACKGYDGTEVPATNEWEAAVEKDGDSCYDAPHRRAAAICSSPAASSAADSASLASFNPCATADSSIAGCFQSATAAGITPAVPHQQLPTSHPTQRRRATPAVALSTVPELPLGATAAEEEWVRDSAEMLSCVTIFKRFMIGFGSSATHQRLAHQSAKSEVVSQTH